MNAAMTCHNGRSNLCHHAQHTSRRLRPTSSSNLASRHKHKHVYAAASRPRPRPRLSQLLGHVTHTSATHHLGHTHVRSTAPRTHARPQRSTSDTRTSTAQHLGHTHVHNSAPQSHTRPQRSTPRGHPAVFHHGFASGTPQSTY